MTYKQSLNIQNFQLGAFTGDGNFDIPAIDGMYGTFEPCDFIGFGERIPESGTYGCHFFLDDYRFQRVWNNPSRYTEILRHFKYVLAPDFSMYVDWPKALSLYNHFRKHWCARYWQDNGINVIPTINWMYEDSFVWCFDGEPHHTTVAVSSTGVNNNARMIEMFRRGYDEMERRLQPSLVLWFGKYCLDAERNNIVFCHTSGDARIARLRRDYARRKEHGTR